MIGILFALAPTSTDVASLSSPDALLMLLVAAAAMLLVSQRVVLAASLLTIGVLIRTDLQLLNICLAAAWLLDGGRRKHTLVVAGVLFSSVIVGAAVNTWAGNYGYAVLYHFTFIEKFIPHPASLRGLGIPLIPFLKNIAFGLRYSLGNGGLWLVLAMLGACAILFGGVRIDDNVTSRTGRMVAFRSLLISTGASTFARFVLFPSHDIRLGSPAVAILTIILLTIAAEFTPAKAPTEHELSITS